MGLLYSRVLVDQKSYKHSFITEQNEISVQSCSRRQLEQLNTVC